MIKGIYSSGSGMQPRLMRLDVIANNVANADTPGYRARVERGVVITVEAFDWNCPKYITPRFTERQVRELVSGGQQEARERQPSHQQTNPVTVIITSSAIPSLLAIYAKVSRKLSVFISTSPLMKMTFLYQPCYITKADIYGLLYGNNS